MSDEEMIFTATDASGNPIGGKLKWSNNYSELQYTVIDSTWGYLPNGTEMNFQKSSDNEVHITDEQWYLEHNIFSSMQSYAMLEVGYQNDVMLYVTVYCGKESLSHLFDVTPNETGEYDELYYFSDDGGSIIYYPSTQSIFYDNNQGLLSGMYY